MNSVSVKPRILYTTTPDNKYQCNICKKTFSCQTNCIRHIHVHDDNLPTKEFSDFTYNGNNVLKSTKNLLLWRTSHGISMNALEDPLVACLFPPGTIQSAKTNQRISDSMCSQILDQNFSKAQNKTISLIIDGGTISHIKWLAIGFQHKANNETKFQLLDVRVFENAKAEYIRNLIKGIADRIKSSYQGEVVAVCTDNASNFKKAFLVPEDKDADFVPIGIIHVSCACHTAQLVLKDLYKEDETYRKLVDIMKIIPSRISTLTMKRLKELNIGFYPPLQSQRWNSVFNGLCYIIKHISALSDLFTEEEIADLQIFDLLQLQKELAPIYTFTTLCESDNATQAHVYLTYRSLEASLQLVDSPRSKRILELFKQRFSTTADLQLARLCYYTTNAGITEKMDKYPHVSLSDIGPLNNENNLLLQKETEFINSFSEIIKKISKMKPFNTRDAIRAFNFMMCHYHPENKNINEYPSVFELEPLFKNQQHEDGIYVTLSKMISFLQILPASEASAERVFARMRDIHSDKQTRLSANTLRTDIVLSYFADEEREKQSCKLFIETSDE